jgi:chromosome segregation ATPase
MPTVVTSDNATEFALARMGLPADVVADDSSEPTVDARADSAEQDDQEAAAQDDQHDTDDREEKTGKKVNPKIERRFSELTKQREEARREAERIRAEKDALEARLREYEAKQAPARQEPQNDAPKADDGKPTPDQYTDAFEYAEALAQWSAEQALRARDKVEQERKAAEQRNQTVKAWEKRVEAFRKNIDDYDEVVASSTVAVSDQVRDAILDSDVGPQLAYYLAKNPDVAEDLRSRSVISALREIGKLEAKLSAESVVEKPVAKPSRAPAPINPIRATRPVESFVDGDGEFNGTYAQYKEARMKGRIK